MTTHPPRFAIVLVISAALGATGCASAPPKGLNQMTIDGVQARTGLSLNQNIFLGKEELPPGISLGRPITQDEAAAIALWNHPQFAADLAALGITRGDLIDAKQLRNPRVDLLFPVGAKPFEFLLNLPLEVIWERPARVRAASLAYDQLATTLIQNAIVIAQDARIAHANLALAKEREQILLNTVNLRKRISKMTSQERVQTGQLTRAEGIATEVESAAAEELWVRSRHDTVLAQERFRLALGLMLGKAVFLVTPNTLDATQLPDSDALVEKALMNRADLKALELATKAAAARAGWESARIAQLSFLLGVKDVGSLKRLTGPGFSAELPLFHLNDGRRARANAEVEMVTMQYLTLKQRVIFDVREARELLIQAQEVLDRTRNSVLPLVKKTVDLAEKEYRRGGASYLFVLEQTRSLVDTQLRDADFAAAVVRAQALLTRSTGGK